MPQLEIETHLNLRDKEKETFQNAATSFTLSQLACLYMFVYAELSAASVASCHGVVYLLSSHAEREF